MTASSVGTSAVSAVSVDYLKGSTPSDGAGSRPGTRSRRRSLSGSALSGSALSGSALSGSAQRGGPRARALGGVPAPSLRRSQVSAARGCLVEATAPLPVRLTERGIAVILVVALMIAVAAAMMIGLTALRVTSPDYLPQGHSQFAQR